MNSLVMVIETTPNLEKPVRDELREAPWCCDHSLFYFQTRLVYFLIIDVVTNIFSEMFFGVIVSVPGIFNFNLTFLRTFAALVFVPTITATRIGEEHATQHSYNQVYQEKY